MGAVVALKFDQSKAKDAAKELRSDPAMLGQLKEDPKAFLAKFGLDVDDNTADLIKKRLSAEPKEGVVQNSIVHIDA
jgi:hypothetical protein